MTNSRTLRFECIANSVIRCRMRPLRSKVATCVCGRLLFLLGFPYSVGVNRVSPRLGTLALILFSAIVVSPQDKEKSTAFDWQQAKGTVTEHLACGDDSAQSYALYLPSRYSPDRAWPVIYAFDPFGRGTVAVEVYRAAAEKYGHIVAASNNSRNGPASLQTTAAQAMWL